MQSLKSKSVLSVTSQLIPEHFVMQNCQVVKKKNLLTGMERRELANPGISFWHFHIQIPLRSFEITDFFIESIIFYW